MKLCETADRVATRKIEPAEQTGLISVPKMKRMLREGYHFCHSCNLETTPIEGENGRVATCGRCGSHRLKYYPPVLSLDRVFLQPDDLK